MINMEKAFAIAKERLPGIDIVQEYMDAYYFYVDDGEIYAGGNSSVIVDKRTGKILGWPEYFMDDKRNIVEVGIKKLVGDEWVKVDNKPEDI